MKMITFRCGVGARGQALAVLFAMTLVFLPGHAAFAEEKSATDLIFSAPYLKQVPHKTAISYSYSHDTAVPEEFGTKFEEAVTVTVNDSTLPDGFNSVAIELNSTLHQYALGPFENTSGNPVVMMFLERDLQQMRSRIGGAPVLFRNTIRRAFRESAEVETVALTIDGASVEGRKITIRPFIDDEQTGQFGRFAGKIFETVVADAVPGGIYAMRSFVPGDGPDKAALVTNILQYQATGRRE